MHHGFLNKINKSYLVILVLLISPNLFNKLNLIDNHEIFSNLNLFNNYIEFLKGHPEIITNFTTTTYRPFFYMIKGIEFFAFKDTSFFYFFVRSVIFIIISLIFYEIAYVYLKQSLNLILLSLFVCVNPYSHDIFFRSGPQEVFVLIFFSYILLILVKDFNNLKISNNSKIIFYICLLLMGLTKEPYVIFSIIFLIYTYLFSKSFKFKKEILLLIVINFFIFFIIYKHYLLNGHTYGASNNYSLNSGIILLLDFFKISKIHNIFFILQAFVIFLNFKKIINKYLILVIFMNIFYFSNFIITNGWVIHRYFVVYLICIFFLLLSIFYTYENSSTKPFKKYIIYFLLSLLSLNIYIYIDRAIYKVKINRNFHNNIYNKIQQFEILEIKKNLVNDREYYLSLVIFLKNLYPEKKITLKNKTDASETLIKKINYENLYSIKFETEKIFDFKLQKKACFYLKKIDTDDFCEGEKIIIK